MALCESEEDPQVMGQGGRVIIGFAFLDAAAGKLYVGTGTDDAGRGNLGAILTQVPIKHNFCGAGFPMHIPPLKLSFAHC